MKMVRECKYLLNLLCIIYINKIESPIFKFSKPDSCYILNVDCSYPGYTSYTQVLMLYDVHIVKEQEKCKATPLPPLVWKCGAHISLRHDITIFLISSRPTFSPPPPPPQDLESSQLLSPLFYSLSPSLLSIFSPTQEVITCSKLDQHTRDPGAIPDAVKYFFLVQ